MTMDPTSMDALRQDTSSSMGDTYNLTTGLNLTNASTCNYKPKQYDPGYLFFRVFLDVFVTGFLCLFGIVGNCISVIVLHKDNVTAKTTRLLLQSLAIADSLCLTTSFISQSLRGIWRYTDWFDPFSGNYPYMYRYVWAFSAMTGLFAILSVVLVTTERYMAICYPLQVRDWCTLTRVRIAIVSVAIFTVLFNLPRFFDKNPITYDDCSKSFKIAGFAEYLEINGKIYAYLYVTVLHYLVNFIIPLCLLMTFNIRIIRDLRESHYRTKERLKNLESASGLLKKRSKQESSTTFMLACIVCVFIICQTPAFAISLVYTLHAHGVQMPDRNLMRYFYSIGATLTTFNSAINFIIYCLVSKLFRTILYRTFCKWCYKRPNDANSEFQSMMTSETPL
ncbi:unnamed protein product [Owenia fusiformis]|uniref:Uncharacterized protein n=1 Tax=Owenia fusiformis TaxID=6347 RepID=A0A8J1ULM9_OWEFU|nr:unnamed protein product [Owenia fusiformis]